MAGRYASLSRSVTSAARASSLRSPATVPRLRPPSFSAPRHRSPFSPPRNFGVLGCTQSFLPFAATPNLTAHLSAQAWACELFHGTFCRTCQDR